MESLFCCPLCLGNLERSEGRYHCSSGHSFDVASAGYTHLLPANRKHSKNPGDDKEMVAARAAFLERGHYAPLLSALCAAVLDQVTASSPVLLDSGCGEGYYTSAMGAVPGVDAYGFDLGKEMVRLAAKRGDATYFVANMKDIPVADGAFDMVTELFAPFNEREFARVLAPEGSLYTVVPGARHLFGLKEVLYDTPYLNDEKLPKTTELELVGTRRVSANITLQTQADIEAVFQMTPYYYRTRPADKERLANLDTLQTDIDFIIAEYRHS